MHVNSDAIQDHRWIRESQKDPEAFKYLFNKYYNAIFNYVLRRTCNSALAKDITANTFMNALDNIKKYRWRGIAFSAWLYRIATNEIHRHYRKAKHNTSLSPQQTASIQGGSSSDQELLEAEQAVIKHEQFRRIHAAIASLKPKYQSAIMLHYFENLSIREIAQILGLSENTVKTHIRRGLNQLKKNYEE
jgi:RNA polymerase sigma-70 factor (ECF subfamily)